MNPCPTTTIIWCSIPSATPENVVDATEVEHVVGDADSYAISQFRLVDEVWWLSDNDGRTTYVDIETNIRLSHRSCLE